MSGVIGMLEVLHQTSLQSHQIEMVDLIGDSAFALLKIIEDILDFSKIESGKLEAECLPLRLDEMVEKVCGLLDHLATKRGATDKTKRWRRGSTRTRRSTTKRAGSGA